MCIYFTIWNSDYQAALCIVQNRYILFYRVYYLWVVEFYLKIRYEYFVIVFKITRHNLFYSLGEWNCNIKILLWRIFVKSSWHCIHFLVDTPQLWAYLKNPCQIMLCHRRAAHFQLFWNYFLKELLKILSITKSIYQITKSIYDIGYVDVHVHYIDFIT